MTTHDHDHEDCTGWHLDEDGRTASFRRCRACNPDGQYPPEPAPWVTLFIVDGVVQPR